MTTNRDIERLKLLAIFHYILAGIMILLSIIPIVQFIMVVNFFFAMQAMSNEALIQQGGSSFLVMGIFIGVIILCCWLFAAALYECAGNLQQRKNRMFCMVVAGLQIFLFPFGTVLGICTLVVLNSDSVWTLFDENSQEP